MGNRSWMARFPAHRWDQSISEQYGGTEREVKSQVLSRIGSNVLHESYLPNWPSSSRSQTLWQCGTVQCKGREMTKYLLVFFGGGIGSMARLFVTSFVGKQTSTTFPWGTLTVNLLGALMIGLLIELMALRWSAPETQRYLLITGFLGGFTTFSAFSLETASMCVRGDWMMAAAYVLASVIGTVGLVILSIHLLRAVL